MLHITEKLLIISIGLSVLLMITSSCQKENEVIRISMIKKSWTESYEESPSNDVQFFRPSEYKEFPPSRFRQIFIFNDQNQCNYLFLAPNDAHFMTEGTWTYEENNRILAIFNNDFEVAHKFELLELKKDILKVRRMY